MRLEADAPPTVFVVLADPPLEREAEFDEWCDTVHGPDALANGSFTAMHRFRAVGDGDRAARYLTLWEGRFCSEAEAWAYIGPRAQAGRAGDVSAVRFALMTFPAATRRGSPCEPVRSLTTVQNDWRDVAGAPDAATWWHAVGLDALDAPARWLVTSDPAGRGAGYHLALFGHDTDAAEAAATSGLGGLGRLGARGMSPLPPYETIFGATRGGDERDRTSAPAVAPAWLMQWEPVTSQRA